MKKYIQRIKDSINKSWNNKTSKTKRLIIYGLLLAYMGFALYVIFMPAPDYRYEEYVRSEPPATNLIIEEEAVPADSLSDEKIREMEEFFNQLIPRAMSNDANALKRKEQIKKILVYGGMVMLCLVSFYFIFKPSKEQVQAEQQKVGFTPNFPTREVQASRPIRLQPTNWRICVSSRSRRCVPLRTSPQ